MDSSEHAVINEVSSEQKTKVDVEVINGDVKTRDRDQSGVGRITPRRRGRR
jgi:hypothetical protein